MREEKQETKQCNKICMIRLEWNMHTRTRTRTYTRRTQKIYQTHTYAAIENVCASLEHFVFFSGVTNWIGYGHALPSMLSFLYCSLTRSIEFGTRTRNLNKHKNVTPSTGGWQWLGCIHVRQRRLEQNLFSTDKIGFIIKCAIQESFRLEQARNRI